jgi:hypothetical protein
MNNGCNREIAFKNPAVRSWLKPSDCSCEPLAKSQMAMKLHHFIGQKTASSVQALAKTG